MRKPLTGHLSMKIHAVKDVAHAATGRFARGPETFVIVKVEDLAKIRTKASRTDRWPDEQHDVQVEKANEIEITVYDKPGDHPLPIGMLWVRISDIVEELRRQKIQSELPQGWMSADGLVNGAPPQQDNHYGAFSPQSSHGHPGGPGGRQSFNKAPAPPQQSNNSQYIDAWFSLEPVGQIHLTMSFSKITYIRLFLHFDANMRQPNNRKMEISSMLASVEKEQSVQERRKCMRCTATNLCSTNFTLSCAVHFVETFSGILLACNALTASIPVTKAVIRRLSPSASANLTQRAIRMRRSLITAFHIDSKLLRTLERIGAATVVIYYRSAGHRTRSAQVLRPQDLHRYRKIS
jgi:hypothetical protein